MSHNRGRSEHSECENAHTESVKVLLRIILEHLLHYLWCINKRQNLFLYGSHHVNFIDEAIVERDFIVIEIIVDLSHADELDHG